MGWVDAGLYAEDEWRASSEFFIDLRIAFRVAEQHSRSCRFRAARGSGVGHRERWQVRSKDHTAGRIWHVLRPVRSKPYATGREARWRHPGIDGRPEPDLLSQRAGHIACGIIPRPTIYRVSPDLRAPYTIQSAGSIERQISKAATVSITYLNSSGEHAFYIRNINAPLVSGGPRSQAAIYGNANIYQYDSEGVFRQNQLIANARLSLSKKVSLFGFYTLNYANSNVAAGGAAGDFAAA